MLAGFMSDDNEDGGVYSQVSVCETLLRSSMASFRHHVVSA